MAGITTDYFAIVSVAPTTAPSVPSGETSFRFNTANSHLYTWSGSTWVDVSTGGGSSLTSASAALSADVTMTTANTWYDGPSLSLAAGSWLITAVMTLYNATTNVVVTGKLWDGTTPVSSGIGYVATSGASVALPFTGIVSPAGTTTYKISGVQNVGGGLMKAAANVNPAGNTATVITAVKIA